MTGSPCRYTQGPTEPPTAPPYPTIHDALTGDADGAPIDDLQNDGTSLDGSGDAGPDTEPGDGRQPEDAGDGANNETPNAHAVAGFAPDRQGLRHMPTPTHLTAADRGSLYGAGTVAVGAGGVDGDA